MEQKKKLVMAVLQESDYDATVEVLSSHQIFVTKLSSSGGFLKKKNVTVMIGVEEERLSQVLEILKGVRPGKGHFSHVGDIKKTGGSPHRFVFGDDPAFILHRQQVSGKGDDFAPQSHMTVVQGCFQFHQGFLLLVVNKKQRRAK